VQVVQVVQFKNCRTVPRTANNDQQIFCLTTGLGFYIKPKTQFTIGPSVVWNYAQYPDLSLGGKGYGGEEIKNTTAS